MMSWLIVWAASVYPQVRGGELAQGWVVEAKGSSKSTA
jgi:hypothetical protein